MTRSRTERGAATVLVVAMAGVLILVGSALAVVTAMVAAHRAAQPAADLAALAGAAAVDDGGDPCAAAGETATANGGRLRLCAVSGRVVDVTVEVAGPRWLGQSSDLAARSRAGPGYSPGAPASRASSSTIAPALSNGKFWLPHFGDCTHEGHPSRQPQARMVSRVAVNQSRADSKPRAEMPAPPG